MAVFQNNAKEQRFEYHVGDAFAYADYDTHEDGILVIKYVEAPHALRGTGAAGILMENIMQHARKEGVKVRPYCGYAIAWLRKHDAHYGDITDL